MKTTDDFTLTKGRLESFSDGVFAIAITLLVLQITLPQRSGPVSTPDQVHDLFIIWPQYLVYFVTFGTIGIMWINHHALFKNVNRVTHGILVTNVLLLAFISFLPFATAVLARYGVTSVAVVYYGIVMVLISIWFTLVSQQVLLAHSREANFTLWNLVGLTLYPFATLVGYFLPMAGLLLMAVLALFYMHPKNVRGVVLLMEG
jgi:uncharacterized membrane protein